MTDEQKPTYRVPIKYWLMRGVFYILLTLLTRTNYGDIKKLPMKGPYLFALNHPHLLDPAVLYAYLGWRNVTGFIGASHQKSRFLRFVGETSTAVWVHRGEGDTVALKQALKAIEQGRIFGITPEGTREPDGKLIEAKTGMAFLVYRSKLPVYPVALTGTRDIMPAWRKFRRAKVTVRIGDPINVADIPVENRSERLQVWTDEIMCQLAALLPPENRGFYADHPRLLEILAEQGEDEATTPEPVAEG